MQHQHACVHGQFEASLPCRIVVPSLSTLFLISTIFLLLSILKGNIVIYV